MQDFEKLGAFYMGRTQDEPTGDPNDELLLYDAKDLTTHAVCVGMTGSGKTGLGIGLLEEAAIDGIPSIVIDPKGDMGNLLLTFPKLAAKDFEPWVDPGEATRKGLGVAEFASKTADLWRNGLADWGQDGERIQRLHDAAELTLYTPGSTNGRPINLLKSFDAPPPELLADSEALSDRIQGSISGLLALLGIDADPIQSREAILLSNIVQRAWAEGRDLDLAELIRSIQDPPFQQLGVLDIDSFFPAKERFQLAMSLNNLLASPGFAAWMQGDPLDVQRLLWTEEGKPRVAILSIAHLSESERMFFVTMLLNEVLAWVRTQSGTSTLRALLYMDEIFGFFPPSKEPPSKKPMLTLLKQARAFGFGVVLATQNPVDLDYKGLSNTGTWFIGRLQTERDKLRVLDGLEGAMRGGGRAFDRAEIDAILSGLGKRVFLLNNVHEEAPVLFRTRWVLSYLRGPLTRDHVKTLCAAQAASAAPVDATAKRGSKAAKKKAKVRKGGERPLLPPGIEESFAPVSVDPGEGERLVYRPALFADARVHYANARAKVDTWDELAVVAPFLDGDDDPVWEEAALALRNGGAADGPDLAEDPEEGASFETLPSAAAKKTSYTRWGKELKNHLYQNRPLVLYKSPTYKLTSTPGQTEGDFRAQVALAAREKRDVEVEKLRDRYANRLTRAKEAIRKAEERLGVQEEQLSQKKKEGWISMGSSLLGALFSRKLKSTGNVGRASRAAKSLGRTAKEKSDVERAERELEAKRETLVGLEADLAEKVHDVQERFSGDDVVLEEVLVRPRKSDLVVSKPVLVWTPWCVGARGAAVPAFRA